MDATNPAARIKIATQANEEAVKAVSAVLSAEEWPGDIKPKILVTIAFPVVEDGTPKGFYLSSAAEGFESQGEVLEMMVRALQQAGLAMTQQN